MFTMDPPIDDLSKGYKPWHKSNIAVRLTSKARRHESID
jgi:hypothetical protein